MLLSCTLALRFGKPILFVHGDTHSYQLNQPLDDAGTGKPGSHKPLVNFTRLEVPGSPWVRWVRGTLYPSAATPVFVEPASE